MKTIFSRWLPAIAETSTRKTALSIAGLAFVGGSLAVPAATVAHGGPALPAASSSIVAQQVAPTKDDHGNDHGDHQDANNGDHKDANKDANSGDHKDGGANKDDHKDANNGDHKDGGANKDDHQDANNGDHKDGGANKDDHSAPKPAPEKELKYQYERQPNFFYCGPAATRIAATTQDHSPSQDDVAKMLGTTENGTNSAEDTTRVLNSIQGKDTYKTRAIPNPTASPAEMDQLQADVVHTVDDGRGVVANIKGTATDVDGGVHSYEGGHYLTVVGYRDGGRIVKIADPADPVGDGSYWMSTINLANWIAERGYSYSA